MAANWLINELFGRLNKESKSIEGVAGFLPLSLAKIIDLIQARRHLRAKWSKDLFEMRWT